ncbi:MAG: histidine phosphatase family protein [Fibrobacter sp.]|nr:histidine phosphatase family protein [Fibrobacter sp.]
MKSKFLNFVCAIALSSYMMGCSDEASASNPGTAEQEESMSSADAGDLTNSSDSPAPSSSGAESQDNPGSATAPEVLAPDADGFYDMEDVYKLTPTTSKIAFVIRHSKREKSLGQESQLTPIGIQMAQTLGAKLASEESFYYASTDFIRTRETCTNIAKGRGEENVDVVTWDGINGGYFLTVPSDTLDALVSSIGGNQTFIAQYAYGKTFTNPHYGELLTSYFYDFFERGNQFINEVIVPNMPSWKRVSILVSHDMLVEPLIVYVSNRTIDLKIYEGNHRWVNYLSGIAVIVDEAGAVTTLPVRGDSVGWMVPREEVDESVK